MCIALWWTNSLRNAVVELYGEGPRNNPDYSKIINAGAVERLDSLIDPEKVVTGGKSDPDRRYIDPTVIYPHFALFHLYYLNIGRYFIIEQAIPELLYIIGVRLRRRLSGTISDTGWAVPS
jgi:hypothetical protein